MQCLIANTNIHLLLSSVNYVDHMMCKLLLRIFNVLLHVFNELVERQCYATRGTVHWHSNG